MIGRALLVVAAGCALHIAGCGEDETFICEGEVVNNTCVPWETPDTAVTPDVPGSPTDLGTPPVDIAEPEDLVEESCLPAVAGIFPVGSACTKHCECSTGYCYDEAYLGSFRFCSKPCSEGCSAEDVGGVQSHTCLLLGGQLAFEHDLTETSICMRVCETVDDCKALSNAYDKCGETLTKTTKWNGTLIASQRTCQIASEVE